MPKKQVKTITFILDSYPVDSQAFITNQFVGVLKAGHQIKIAVNKINNITGSSQESTIKAYDLMRYVHKIETKSITKGLLRYWQLLILFFYNMQLSKSFLVILKSKYKDKLRLCEKLISHNELLKDEIFHVQFADNGQFLMTLKALGLLKHNAKIITTFHGYDAHFTRETFSLRRIELYPVFEYSDKIIVNSKYLKRQVETLGCPVEKIEIIGVAYNADIFKLKKQNNNETIKILSVGRLIDFKGHIYGLKVVKRLIIDHKINIHFTIIGEGVERKSLEAFVKDKSLNNHVSLVGAKSQLEIAKYLSKTDLFLMTSVSNTVNRCETFGLVSVEAQANGVPVVAFDSGGVSETIKNKYSGFLIPEKNIDEMVKCILELIKDKNTLTKISKNAASFAKQNFTSKKIAEKHIEIYNS